MKRNRQAGKKKAQGTTAKTWYSLILLVVLISGTAIMAGIYFGRSKDEVEPRTVRINRTGLLETKPVLSPELFSGKIAMAYRLASEIPEVIDKQFCYCYCRKNHGHKTLLTCFTSIHGAECDICMNEVFRASELYKRGYSIEEITAAIDKEFERYKEHQHFH